jgi:hypothetical protein
MVRRAGVDRLTVVGYRGPQCRRSDWIDLAGGWSRRRGWVPLPQERLGREWDAAAWRLFTFVGPEGLPVRTRPAPVEPDGEGGPGYEATREIPPGVLLARAGVVPRPRRARRQGPDRAELRRSTRLLLAEHGIPAPARPRILESCRVDLNGDGVEEVLWTARSRDGWTNTEETSVFPGSGPRPDDYVLLGLRYLTRRGVRSVALALDSADTSVAWYHLFCPLDINGDGRMEILAHVEGFEKDGLAEFTFDGRRVAGVIGTRLPGEE